MPLFDGAYTKVRRARHQTNALKLRFKRFYKGEHHIIRQEVDAETCEKRLVFRAEPLPLVWSAIIGEIMHDLRSALGHAIYELTVIEIGHPSDGSEFPVFEDEEKYFALDKRGRPMRSSGLFKIRGINERARTIVEQLQPFRSRMPGNEPVVALIENLNIIDKHRTLLLSRMSTTGMQTRVVRDIHPISLTVIAPKLEDGAVLAHWKPVGTFSDEVDMEAQVTFEIAFDDTLPVLQGKSVIVVCQSLIRGVERVLHYLSNSVHEASNES